MTLKGHLCPAVALPAALIVALSLLHGLVTPHGLAAQPPASPATPRHEVGPSGSAVATSPMPRILEGPTLTENPQAPPIAPARPAGDDRALPINLATALYLSNARPLVIAFARWSVEEAAARLQSANVLWLPNLNAGFDYYRHDGADQATDGSVIFDSRNAFATGGGATLFFGVTDAIFLPLAARQELSARQWDLQAARNDALLAVAIAYFDVQQARGRLAGTLDAVAKNEDLVRRIEGLAKGLVAEIEVDRARSLLADLNQQAAAARSEWRVSSARLTRTLRLNPSSVVVPLEPPHLQVRMIAPGYAVDDLVPIGLTTRPELASQRALVQATVERLRQERLRPLIPSVVLGGRGPVGAINGGTFGGGVNDRLDTWGGRFDMDAGLVWTLSNLGAGNRALVRQRAAQQQKALIELFNTQDQVAQEVVQAHAQVEAAASQVADAEIGVKESLITFQGNLKGISQTRGAGDLLQLINRPQEAVAALQQLSRAYDNYFAAINGYNRAQFQLYHALGCPSRIVAAEQPAGEIQPIDTSRPAQMAPVCPHVLSSPD